MVTLDQMIKGQHVPGEQLAHTYGKGGPIMPSRKFNEQLGNLLGELHSTKLRVKGIRPHQMHSVIKSLMPMATKDEYIEDALFDLAELKGPLGEERCIIHGDLWRQNIFVDEQGNLTGLIDWEAKSKCNPHWEFRMVHRWIGWNGLEELLTHYHKHVPWKIDIDVVEVLNRVSIANSIRIREERGLLRHDEPDAIQKFERMKMTDAQVKGYMTILIQTRPSADVEWSEQSEDHKAHIMETYRDTGKMITTNTMMSKDGLSKTSRTLFKDKSANIDYLEDPVIVARRELLSQYNKEQGIESFVE